MTPVKIVNPDYKIKSLLPSSDIHPSSRKLRLSYRGKGTSPVLITDLLDGASSLKYDKVRPLSWVDLFQKLVHESCD